MLWSDPNIIFRAFFCTRDLGKELEDTLEHSGTATYNPYRRYNLVRISQITYIACTHVGAR